jgi:hypothetical protein
MGACKEHFVRGSLARLLRAALHGTNCCLGHAATGRERPQELLGGAKPKKWGAPAQVGDFFPGLFKAASIYLACLHYHGNT